MVMKEGKFKLEVDAKNCVGQVLQLNEFWLQEHQRLYSIKIRLNVGMMPSSCIASQSLLDSPSFRFTIEIASGKAQSQWTGPYKGSRVYGNKTTEIDDAKGLTFKANGQQLEIYIGMIMM